MKDINFDEQIALAKLSQYIASGSMINVGEYIWIANMFGIVEYQDVNKWLLYTMDFGVAKNTTIFNFLQFAYSKYHNKFPKLMEEILRRCIFNNLSNLAKYKEQAKNLFEIMKRSFSQNLSILGYEMNVDIHGTTFDFISVKIIARDIDESRREDQGRLHNILEKQFYDEYIALKGAYERYSEGGINANRQALSSCRNAYENFFKKITENQNWKSNLDKHIQSTTFVKFIKDTYSYLSGSGDHSPIERTREDTFLGIRLTEEVIIRVLIEVGLWQ